MPVRSDLVAVHRALRALVFVSLLLTACASYQIPPLTENHPADPRAPAAPETPPSRALVYTPSDIPSVRPVSPVAAIAQEGHGTRLGEEMVVGEGEVVATVPTASQVVLDHEEIKGFMEPMTMGYRVDPPSLLEGLKPGDRVRFKIDVQKRTITSIERLQ
jgi:Cu/Ag efflux protein CusF